MIKEEVDTEAELVSVPLTRVLDVAAELENGRFDFVIADLVDGRLPPVLDEARSRGLPVPMLGIGHGRAVLYEASSHFVDLGDKPLRDLLSYAGDAAVASQARRRK